MNKKILISLLSLIVLVVPSCGRSLDYAGAKEFVAENYISELESVPALSGKCDYDFTASNGASLNEFLFEFLKVDNLKGSYQMAKEDISDIPVLSRDNFKDIIGDEEEAAAVNTVFFLKSRYLSITYDRFWIALFDDKIEVSDKISSRTTFSFNALGYACNIDCKFDGVKISTESGKYTDLTLTGSVYTNYVFF